MDIREMLRDELRLLLWGYNSFDLTPFGSFVDPKMIGGDDFTCLMGLETEKGSVLILCEYWAGADEIERSYYSVFGSPVDLNGIKGDYEALAALRVYLRENGACGMLSDVKMKDQTIDNLWDFLKKEKPKELTSNFILENQKNWMGILRDGR